MRLQNESVTSTSGIEKYLPAFARWPQLRYVFRCPHFVKRSIREMGGVVYAITEGFHIINIVDSNLCDYDAAVCHAYANADLFSEVLLRNDSVYHFVVDGQHVQTAQTSVLRSYSLMLAFLASRGFAAPKYHEAITHYVDNSSTATLYDFK